jgi:hypothetical protein
VGNGRRTTAAHGGQRIAGVEEGGGGGVLGCGRVKSKRGSGMGREGAGEALELEERG